MNDGPALCGAGDAVRELCDEKDEGILEVDSERLGDEAGAKGLFDLVDKVSQAVEDKPRLVTCPKPVG